MALSDIVKSEILLVKDFTFRERYSFDLYNMLRELDCCNSRDGLRVIIFKLFEYIDRFHDQIKEIFKIKGKELMLLKYISYLKMSRVKKSRFMSKKERESEYKRA